MTIFFKVFVLLWLIRSLQITYHFFHRRQKYHNPMERVQFLIEKLHTQQKTGAAASQLLITVQLLHHELLQMQQPQGVTGSRKVAVIMPTVTASALPVVEKHILTTEERDPVVEKPVIVNNIVEEPKVESKPLHQQSFFDLEKEESETFNQPMYKSQQAATVAVTNNAYSLQKPAQVQPEPVKQEPIAEEPVYYTLPFDVVEETPTLTQRQSQKKEVHEYIGEKKASLNDKLKQEQTELLNVLKDAPIKDLRKGIGVNDKFLFINELFRGDEAMYERSIKTINSFHILAEAEYWINRELKVKIGWNDNNETVQYFYQLVRRRFA